MNKRLTLFIVLCFFALTCSYAGKVSKETANLVAKNFYYERVTQFKTIDYHNVKIKNIITEQEHNTILYYGINFTCGGFVIISADDAVIPVLGYSFEGEYTGNDKPSNFSAWMEQYGKTISWCQRENINAPAEVSSEWKRLATQDMNSLKNLKDAKGVLPLIISNWDQGKFYDAQCPSDPQGPDGHALTGCVATAMGQIMYYYRWPEHGTGSYTYQHPVYGTLSADFGGATYEWDNMENQLQSYNDGVAKLLYHIGVSVDMNYGPLGSGMWNHHAALSYGTYFKYLPSTQYVWRDTTNLDWDSLIIAHLDRGQIMYYAGWSDTQYIGGHAFVCDGYQDTGYCHFNWGWSGQYNGYFYLNALNPGGNNFNLVQELVINIYPDTLQYTYPNYCQGTKTLHYQNGTLEDGSGPIADYQNNQTCSWLIDPQYYPYDSVSSITLSFQKFNTESNQDILTIYDGATTSDPVLGTFSGNNLPSNLTSTGNKVLVVFNTNNSITGKGWFISYKSNLPDYCGTASLTEPTGTISDGSGPKYYLNNTLCTWSIQPSNASGLALSFTSFHTEPVKDFVEVYDMNNSALLGKFSGDQLPPTVTSPSGKMYILFKTNGTVTSSGWSANYTVTNLGIDQSSNSVQLDLFPNPADESLVIGINGAGVKQYTWQILDNCGRIVLSGAVKEVLPDGKTTLDVGKIAGGCYILQVLTDKGVISRKISIL